MSTGKRIRRNSAKPNRECRGGLAREGPASRTDPHQSNLFAGKPAPTAANAFSPILINATEGRSLPAGDLKLAMKCNVPMPPGFHGDAFVDNPSLIQIISAGLAPARC